MFVLLILKLSTRTYNCSTVERPVEIQAMDRYTVLGFLISLAITLVAYGTFPLVFALLRKTPISKKKYRIYCYVVNFLVWTALLISDLSKSAAPYILWTTIFSNTDAPLLPNVTTISPQAFASPAPPTEIDTTVPPPILFCRKSGNKLDVGSKFCSQCGLEILKEDEEIAVSKM